MPTLQYLRRVVALLLLIAFCVFRYYLLKPLKHLTEQLKPPIANPIELKGELMPVLDMNNHIVQDELDDVVFAINNLLEEVLSSYNKLAIASDELEKKVQEKPAAYRRILEYQHKQSEHASVGLMMACVTQELCNPLGAIFALLKFMQNVWTKV